VRAGLPTHLCRIEEVKPGRSEKLKGFPQIRLRVPLPKPRSRVPPLESPYAQASGLSAALPPSGTLSTSTAEARTLFILPAWQHHRSKEEPLWDPLPFVAKGFSKGLLPAASCIACSCTSSWEGQFLGRTVLGRTVHGKDSPSPDELRGHGTGCQNWGLPETGGTPLCVRVFAAKLSSCRLNPQFRDWKDVCDSR